MITSTSLFSGQEVRLPIWTTRPKLYKRPKLQGTVVTRQGNLSDALMVPAGSASPNIAVGSRKRNVAVLENGHP